MVSLAAGAALSTAASVAIAVAWSSTQKPSLREDGITLPSDQPRWSAQRQWYPGLTRWTTYWRESDSDRRDYAPVPNTPPDELVPHWATFVRERFIGNEVRMHFFVLVESGWPVRSLAGGVSRVSSPPSEDVRTEHFARQIGDPAPQFIHQRVLPLRPIPVGLAVNTSVYGAAIWAALFLPGHLRRASRRRRGCCVGCGYPLDGSVTCPECGLAISA